MVLLHFPHIWLDFSRTVPTSYFSILHLKARYWPESGRYVLVVHICHTPCPSSSAIVYVLRCLPLQEPITAEITLWTKPVTKKKLSTNFGNPIYQQQNESGIGGFRSKDRKSQRFLPRSSHITRAKWILSYVLYLNVHTFWHTAHAFDFN